MPTYEESLAYLKSLGYTDPDRKEIEGATEELLRNPALRKTTTPAKTPAPTPTPTPGTATTSGSSDFVSRLQKDRKDFESGIGSAPVEPTLEGITEEKRKAAEASVDRIREDTSRLIQGARETGAETAARTAALSRGAGLSGSNVAVQAANRNTIDQRKAIETLERERDTKVNEVLAGVADRASEEYIKRRTLFLQENRDRREAIKDFETKVQERVGTEIDSIASAGMTFDDFVGKYPNEYQQILKESGMSEAGVKARFIANAPQGKVVNLDKPLIANGKATYFYQKINPQTGLPEFTPVEVELPKGYAEAKSIKEIFSRKDGLYVINDDGSYKVIGKPEPSGDETKPPGTSDEQSLVMRWAQTQGATPEDLNKLKSDSGFFYAMLQKAYEDPDFSQYRTPLKSSL